MHHFEHEGARRSNFWRCEQERGKLPVSVEANHGARYNAHQAFDLAAFGKSVNRAFPIILFPFALRRVSKCSGYLVLANELMSQDLLMLLLRLRFYCHE